MPHHPFTWYALHIGRTGVLRDREGNLVKNPLIYGFKTIKKYGFRNGLNSLILENMFPILGKRVFYSKYKLFEERWKTMESVLSQKIINNKKKNLKVFDIGCGAGDLIFFISEYGKKCGKRVECVGVDIDNEAINFAKNISKQRGLDLVKFYWGDLVTQKMKYNGKIITFSNFFKKVGRPDILVTEGVLEWLDDKKQSLKNIFGQNVNEGMLLTTSDDMFKNPMPNLLMKIIDISGYKSHRGINKQQLIDMLNEVTKKKYKILSCKVSDLKGEFMVLVW